MPSAQFPVRRFWRRGWGCFGLWMVGHPGRSLGLGSTRRICGMGGISVPPRGMLRIFFACVADWSRGVAVRLYRSQDGGGSWAQVDHSVDVQSKMMAVGLTASDQRQAHCVTRRGQTFSTLDDGASWRAFGLPEGAGSAVTIACG